MADCDEYDYLGYDEYPEVPKGKVVNGFIENEYEPEQGCDRADFTNYEVSEHLDCYFRFFGAKDMDIIYLYFLSKKRQDELMDILDKTQPAISYDVTRIKNQMDFVTRLIAFLDEFIMFVVDEKTNLTTHEREVLTAFMFSTSIVKTAKILGLNHITCRTHLLNTIDKLNYNGYKREYEFFNYIYNNLNRVKKNLNKE